MKNNILYRRFWYAKRRRTQSLHFLFQVASIVIILLILASYAQKSFLPKFLETSEEKWKAEMAAIIAQTFEDSFPQGIKYEDLMFVSRSQKGEITAIQNNSAAMNALSQQIALQLGKQLDRDAGTVTLPLGTLFNENIFGCFGPGIQGKLSPSGKVEILFVSRFEEKGAELIVHKIILSVKTKMYVSSFLAGKTSEFEVEIPVTEAVILRDAAELV